MTEGLFTAYESDSRGGWTVWDHIADAPVAADIPQEQAVQLAAQLQAQHL
jgi:hypothetical protein